MLHCVANGVSNSDTGRLAKRLGRGSNIEYKGKYGVCHCLQYMVTPTIDPWHHDILQLYVLPLMQWHPGAISQQDNSRPHTEEVCHKTRLQHC
ncbi:hypothetical protein TNCV_553301 [Trichonephila clavipes]|nr:hypothetical protein TNCV_553301 [Trichonephila clavipes]